MVTTGHPGCRGSPPHTTQSPAPRQHCSYLSLRHHKDEPPRAWAGQQKLYKQCCSQLCADLSFQDGTGVLLSTGPAPPTQPSLTKAGSTGQVQAPQAGREDHEHPPEDASDGQPTFFSVPHVHSLLNSHSALARQAYHSLER